MIKHGSLISFHAKSLARCLLDFPSLLWAYRSMILALRTILAAPMPLASNDLSLRRKLFSTILFVGRSNSYSLQTWKNIFSFVLVSSERLPLEIFVPKCRRGCVQRGTSCPTLLFCKYYICLPRQRRRTHIWVSCTLHVFRTRGTDTMIGRTVV